ncbi:MAG: choline-sulfatase [Rhodobacteraceae bacterium]|nr:choline-sulfatase [Paracoccaceae bacterium]
MSKCPNILIFMVDQLAGPLFPEGPAEWLAVPNLKALAERSLRFQNAYTPFPLCAPARAAFMSGQLASRTRIYDNAAEFASDIPTFAHHLRDTGYRTCLSGKMHFVGPDQLHGFEERLTTDIYPADFGWTPDYRNPDTRVDWWYHNLGSVTSAGVAETTNQLEYDDEVAYHATRKIYEFGSGRNDQPWLLTVSFTHPHDPYVCRRKFWDVYADCRHLSPSVAAIPYAMQDPHSQRILDASDHRSHTIREQDIARARRAYFGNISYIDEQIGDVLTALRAIRQEDRTIIIFVADHGDMLGERGLWFKMSFFEWSARVPLMIAGPGILPQSMPQPVSIVDVTPTLAEIAGVDIDGIRPWIDGDSLLADPQRPVLMEYTAEASASPLLAVRSGEWKYITCRDDPPLLFNLVADPEERRNLAGAPDVAAAEEELRRIVAEQWDPVSLDEAVRQSQAQRHIVYRALRNGEYYPWDYQPLQQASERYMRNHMDLNVVDRAHRFPRDE